jgi:PleD family two-component response regulator
MDNPLALIIEDERDIAALFRHVLDVAGYRTEIVMDGKEALLRLGSERPDIILLDLNLPGVSGPRILEQIHADERLMTVPVVVITGHSEMADSLPFEPDLVLLKPVNLEQLSNLVQRLQTTHGAKHNLPWDKVTHLYNQEFFTARIVYSLERAKQIENNRFGVMFVDFVPFQQLQRQMDKVQLNGFLRKTASHLKTLLRPTDTVSHFDQGLFLILVEEILREDVLSKIANRVENEMVKFLSLDPLMAGLHTYVGVIICDAGYDDAEEINRDINFARIFAKTEKEITLYDKATLAARRNST